MINWNKYFEYNDGFLYWKDVSKFDEISHLSRGKFKCGKLVGHLDKSLRNGKPHAINGYWKLQFKIYGKTHRLKVHRIIWEMFNGRIPDKVQIDHINGDGSDNRIENLRLSTPSQNSTNRKSDFKNKTSKYKGVWFRSSRNRWVASLRFNNQYHWIGSFRTEEEARKVYLEKASEICGEFFNPGDISK